MVSLWDGRQRRICNVDESEKSRNMIEWMRLIEPVSGHYDKENGRAELSYRTTDHVQFAYSVTYGKSSQSNYLLLRYYNFYKYYPRTENPLAEVHRIDEDRHANKKELIGKCQIKNVKVCDRFHFTEAEDHAEKFFK